MHAGERRAGLPGPAAQRLDPARPGQVGPGRRSGRPGVRQGRGEVLAVPAPGAREGVGVKRLRTAGVVAGVLTVGAVAFLNLPEAESRDQPDATGPAGTAEIIRQTLTDRESHDGTLGHGATATVTARGSGTVTALPAGGA